MEDEDEMLPITLLAHPGLRNLRLTTMHRTADAPVLVCHALPGLRSLDVSLIGRAHVKLSANFLTLHHLTSYRCQTTLPSPAIRSGAAAA